MTERGDKPKRNWAAFVTGEQESSAPAPQRGAAPSEPARSGGSRPGQGSAPRRRPTRATRPARQSLPAARSATAATRPAAPQATPQTRPQHRPDPARATATLAPDDDVVMVLEEDPYGEPLVDPRYDMDDRNWVRYRSGWGGFLRIVGFIVVLLVTVLWARGRLYGWVDAQIDPGGEWGAPVEFTIPEGASTNDVASALDANGVISNPTVFRYWLRCEGELTITGFLGCDTEKAFQAGDYTLHENMSFEEAVAVLDEGPAPVVFTKITIPEGLRWTEMVDRLLKENPEFDRAELEAAFADPVIASDYLGPNVPGNTMEGLLFPATYDVAEEDLANELLFLKRMSDTFDQRYGALLANPGIHPDIVELELDTYQIITIASLIEEEARLDIDRPKIARVIYNRLLAGERLDIDASACYAPNIPCSELTRSILDDPNPWNTRAVHGIPPTPIAAPREASLAAALQPAEGDWIYYTLTDENGVPGAHSFAVDDAERAEHLRICTELGYCG